MASEIKASILAKSNGPNPLQKMPKTKDQHPQPAPKKPEPVGDRTRTARAKAHLVRLAAEKGKRLLVDLDAEGHAALNELLASGYGASNKEVVVKALITENKRISQKFKTT